MSKLSFYKNRKDYLLKIKENIHIVSILVLALLVYWCLMPIFSFDSSWYISYLDYFTGVKPMDEFGTNRGVVFPFILWIAYKIKPGIIGLEVVFCLFYMVFVIYVLKTFVLIKQKMFHNRFTKWNAVFISVILVFNPIIWGYFHVILTECISISLSSIYIFYSLRFFIARSEDKCEKKEYIFYVILSCVFTILYWHLKQSFFVNTLFVLGLFEIYFFIRQVNKKKVIYFVVLFVSIMVTLKGSMVVWDTVIDESKSSNDAGILAIGMCQLRYFLPLDTVGKSGTIISVRDDSYEEIGTFEYKFENDITNRVGYLLECLKRYPGRVLQGYVDNYLCMSDVYRKEEFYNGTYQYGPVTRQGILATMFDGDVVNHAGENRLIVRNNLCEIDFGDRINQHRQTLREALNIQTDILDYYEYVSKPNIITKLMQNAIWWDVTIALYAILMVSAPFVALFSFIMYFKSKKDIIWAINGTLSLYAWAFVFMHVFLGQACIDRYALPSYFAMLIVFGIVVFEIQRLLREGKEKNESY